MNSNGYKNESGGWSAKRTNPRSGDLGMIYYYLFLYSSLKTTLKAGVDDGSLKSHGTPCI